MFEIALNKCTVLLSTTGLEENIPTIEALIWAQRAVPQQPGAKFFPPAHRIEALVSQHPLLDERRIVGGVSVKLQWVMLFSSAWLTRWIPTSGF